MIQTIYKHCAEEGWLKPGDTVLDCFSGTGLGGLDAALAGYRFIGCELELRFHAIAHGFDCGGSAAKHEACSQQGDHAAHHVTGNLELWARRYGHLPQYVAPTLLQGDSRELGKILREQVSACVASPPFQGSLNSGTLTEEQARICALRDNARDQTSRDIDTRVRTMLRKMGHSYGTTEGQLGSLPPGTLDACLASPPHCHGLGKEHTYADHAKRDRGGGRRILHDKSIADPYYGRDPAQLGNMREGPRPHPEKETP